jgi:hypothetical protein
VANRQNSQVASQVASLLANPRLNHLVNQAMSPVINPVVILVASRHHNRQVTPVDNRHAIQRMNRQGNLLLSLLHSLRDNHLIYRHVSLRQNLRVNPLFSQAENRPFNPLLNPPHNLLK